MSIKGTSFNTSGAETAEYDVLINNHFDNNTLPHSQQYKQNGHVIKKVKYTYNK